MVICKAVWLTATCLFNCHIASIVSRHGAQRWGCPTNSLVNIWGRCTNYRPNKFYSLTLTPPPQSSNHSKSPRCRGSLINASTSRADLVKVGARLFRARDSADVMWSCLAAELKRVSCGRKLADITNSDNGNNSSHKPARRRTQYSPHISTYGFRRIRYGYHQSYISKR